MKPTPKQSFFSADLPSDELALILQRIDEHVVRRTPLAVSEAAPTSAVALLPDARELAGGLQVLREQHAPFFVVRGRRPADLLRLVLNLPIRVFGYKQAQFNAELLNLLDLMLITLQGERQRAVQQQAEIQRLQAVLEQIRTGFVQQDESASQGQ